MPDHLTSTRSADDTNLTDAEVDRALVTALARGGVLVRRRNRRRAVLSGLGAAVLLAGGFGMLSSLSDDEHKLVVTPAGDAADKESTSVAPTTTAPPVSTSVPVPEGFERTQEGDVVILRSLSTAVIPTSVAGNGVSVGGGLTIVPAASLSSVEVRSPWVHLEFECQRSTGDHIDEVRYRLVDDVLTVQATITGGAPGADCSGGSGSSIDLTFPSGVLADDVSVEAGRITP